MNTPSRQLFGALPIDFGFGGAAGMKAGPFLRKTMRNYPKLSWKSTTCDAWPALLIDQNRIAGGFFATAPFAADLIPKISMNKPYKCPNTTTIPHILGTANAI
jgi:hypothetical protein